MSQNMKAHLHQTQHKSCQVFTFLLGRVTGLELNPDWSQWG